jgi:hypothetical protein
MNDTDNLIDRMMQGLPVKVDEQRLYIVTPSMTAKQYAAIHLKVPMSGDPELDQMIRESRRLDFAEKASFDGNMRFLKEEVHRTFSFVDALLVEWDKEAKK